MYEERLVLETDRFNVIATLGQIVEGYLLIMPKRHLPSIGDLAGADLEAYLGLKRRVQAALVREDYGPAISFEHGVAGQSVAHAHTHVVPAEADLHTVTAGRHPAWRDIADERSLAAYRRAGRPYLMFEDLAGRMRVYGVLNARPQHFRIALAEAFGTPEWADWKTADRHEDERRWRRTVARLRGRV